MNDRYRWVRAVLVSGMRFARTHASARAGDAAWRRRPRPPRPGARGARSGRRRHAGQDRAREAAPRAKLSRLSDERLLSRWAHPARLADVYRGTTPVSPRRAAAVLHRGRIPRGLPADRAVDERGRRRVGQDPRPQAAERQDGLGTAGRARARSTSSGRSSSSTARRCAPRSSRAGADLVGPRRASGRPSTPTPAGRFWIREKFRFKNTPVYGTHALGTAAYAPTLSDWPNGGVVGLHGTNQPGLIPGRPSHGCIRIKNADIARLWRLTPVGHAAADQ